MTNPTVVADKGNPQDERNSQLAFWLHTYLHRTTFTELQLQRLQKVASQLHCYQKNTQ